VPALAACGGSKSPANAAAAERSREGQDEAKLAKFAKCMREHGVNVHASASDGRVQLQVGGPGANSGPNPESPSFQAAQKACQSLLPFKAKGGPGGGPSTSSEGGGPGRGAGAGASLGVGG